MSDFVRYCLFQDTLRLPIRQADIGKAVVKEYSTKGRNLSKYVLEKGREKLADVFGLDLVELPKSVVNEEEDFKSSGSFILRPQQAVEKLLSAIDAPLPGVAVVRALLLAMLVAVDMHDRTSVPEIDFKNSLDSLDLISNVMHPVFGAWETQLQTFYRQQYLVRSRGPSVDGQSNFEVGFGARAITEFGRVGIRTMTCKLLHLTPDPARMKALRARDDALSREVADAPTAERVRFSSARDGEVPSARRPPRQTVDLVD